MVASVATQRLCGVDDEVHAHQLLADLGASHSAAHPDPNDGRICVYVPFIVLLYSLIGLIRALLADLLV